MYPRQLTQQTISRISHNPAVAILGPRRIGKTTLARAIARGRPSKYLNLKNHEDFQKLDNPAHYLGLHADRLVILDEVQRYPDLFLCLRGLIDAGRREGHGNGRFLILSSATNALLKQSAESLAGRISYSELTGLNPFEIEASQGAPLQKLWMRGGFPRSYTALSDRASYRWLQDFIRTYIERDIPQLGPRIPAATLTRLWRMLAKSQGAILNASELARPLDVSSVTVNRYLDILVDLMLVRRLAPWHGGVTKRLVKSPRTYVRDSGIMHALLQIPNYEMLLGHPALGKSWEGFVIETIIATLPFEVQPCFYRTSAGAEIDLVLEFGSNEYWAVEIKLSRTPRPTKGFHIACEDLKAKRKFVVYGGDDRFPGDNNITILSLSYFIEELRKRIG